MHFWGLGVSGLCRGTGRLQVLALREGPKISQDKILTNSEAWGPPQFQEKRSRSEKAILGALGEFWGILGAALEIPKLILGMQNSILGMASHDLSNTKITILGATPGAIPGIDGHPHQKDFHLPMHSRSVSLRIGVAPVHQPNSLTAVVVLL